MISDNIYREKSMPSPLRYIWRIFYHDAMSMIGLYGFTLLILLCLFGSLIAPYQLDFSVINCCRLPGRAMAMFLSFWAPTTWAATFSAGC
jgi:cationic peptide transport system permease protein